MHLLLALLALTTPVLSFYIVTITSTVIVPPTSTTSVPALPSDLVSLLANLPLPTTLLSVAIVTESQSAPSTVLSTTTRTTLIPPTTSTTPPLVTVSSTTTTTLPPITATLAPSAPPPPPPTDPRDPTLPNSSTCFARDHGLVISYTVRINRPFAQNSCDTLSPWLKKFGGALTLIRCGESHDGKFIIHFNDLRGQEEQINEALGGNWPVVEILGGGFRCLGH